MIHLYAFATDLSGLPAVDGLDGEPLQVRAFDELAAVVSVRRRETTAACLREDAVVHGTVVESLVPLATAVLPVRFGEVSADDDELERAVRERCTDLRRSLARVRGCVEIGVRVADVPAPRAETGTDYLRSRQAGGGEQLHAELRPVARATRRRAGAAAYLVARPDVPEIERRVHAFTAAHPEVGVVCTGPWAPYSFATEQAR